MIALDREELAWAAGFFDGEGCTTYDVQHRLKVQIGQIDREVLDRFQRAVGGVGRIYGPYPTKRYPQFRYQIHSHEGVQFVVAALWPWPGTIKRKQALNALERWLTRASQAPAQ